MNQRSWAFRLSPVSSSRLERGLAAVAPLLDQARLRLFEFVRAAPQPVTREQAAEAVGISRKLAAFHLDKLVESRLLRASYAKQTRGVGRSSKLYATARVSLELSLPERRYDLIGRVLAEAVLQPGPGESAEDAAHRLAQQRGARLGKTFRSDSGTQHPADRVRDLLQKHGFEPVRSNSDLILRNCPFETLANDAPQLVCGMNHAFIDGLLRGIGDEQTEAMLDPGDGRCCVKLRLGRDPRPEGERGEGATDG